MAHPWAYLSCQCCRPVFLLVQSPLWWCGGIEPVLKPIEGSECCWISTMVGGGFIRLSMGRRRGGGGLQKKELMPEVSIFVSNGLYLFLQLLRKQRQLTQLLPDPKQLHPGTFPAGMRKQVLNLVHSQQGRGLCLLFSLPESLLLLFSSFWSSFRPFLLNPDILTTVLLLSVQEYVVVLPACCFSCKISKKWVVARCSLLVY